MKILTAMSEDGTFGSYHEPTMARRWQRSKPATDSALHREWWQLGWGREETQIGLQVQIENLLSVGLWGSAE